MANTLQLTLFCILTISIFLLPSTQADGSLKVNKLKRMPMKEKLSHIRLYWHDVVSGRNPTSVPVVRSPPTAPNGFGQVNMIDNPLTLGPEMNSTIVGKAQGFYALASQENIELLMAMNFFITDGKFNGSTISVIGRNAIFNQVREMAVVGGSGLFRFARGYAQARTHWLDLNSGDATVRYDIYVMHY